MESAIPSSAVPATAAPASPREELLDVIDGDTGRARPEEIEPERRNLRPPASMEGHADHAPALPRARPAHARAPLRALRARGRPRLGAPRRCDVAPYGLRDVAPEAQSRRRRSAGGDDAGASAISAVDFGTSRQTSPPPSRFPDPSVGSRHKSSGDGDGVDAETSRSRLRSSGYRAQVARMAHVLPSTNRW